MSFRKLPKATLARLQGCFDGKATPSHGSPAYGDFYDLFSDLTTALSEAFNKNPVALTANQRRCAALCMFWEALPWSGLLVGVMANQPEIITPALEAAQALNLPRTHDALSKLNELVPAVVRDLTDPEKRLGWFDTAEGEPSRNGVEEIEEDVNEESTAEEILVGAMGLPLLHPTEFFEMS